MPFIKGKYIFVSEIRIYNAHLLIVIAKLCHNLLHRWIIFRLYLGPQLLFKTEFIITHASGRTKNGFGRALPDHQKWGEPPGIPTRTG